MSHPKARLVVVTSTLDRAPAGTGMSADEQRLGVVVTGSLTGVPAGIVGVFLDDLLADCSSDGIRMTIVEGGMPGADSGARRWASGHRHAVDHVQIAPDWRQYGGHAYRVANQLLLDAVRPALVLAFSQTIGSCYRARDLIARASAASVPFAILGSSADGPMRFLPDPPPDSDAQRVLFEGFGLPSDAWRRRANRAAGTLFRGGD